jgi:filamentous hemagglutinin
LIAKKANGDKALEERLAKAACYEVKCWAQFPEGSPLYKQNYVSQDEAAGLTPELAWVNQQKTNGEFACGMGSDSEPSPHISGAATIEQSNWRDSGRKIDEVSQTGRLDYIFA